MKPDLKQIAAGLVLAEISTEALARDVGMEFEQLRRVMNNEIEPSPELLGRLQLALESRQVEFGPRSGVSLKDEYIRRLTGIDSFLRLLDEILRTTMGTNDEVLFFMVEHSMWLPAEKNAEQRLWDVGVKCRYICPEKATGMNGPKNAYRVLPRLYDKHQVQVIYGKYVATVSEDYLDKGILILNNEPWAMAERSKFNFMWEQARPAE